MFSRVIPSWEQIGQFKQQLTEGELYILKFLDDNLEKDTTFNSNNLTEYNGWLIFVQPFLNGSRPDVVIFNPNIGVQIFEVKDINLNNYSFKNSVEDSKNKIFCVSDDKGTYRKKSPIQQVKYYKEKIIGQLIPQIGENIDKNKNSYSLVKTSVYFHKSTSKQAQELFKYEGSGFFYHEIFGNDSIKKDNINKIVPDSRFQQNKYWKKEWNEKLLFWLNPPLHTIEQGIKLNLLPEQSKFAEPKSGHFRVRGVAGSGKTQVLAYRAGELASHGYNVLVLTYNLTLWHYVHDMIQRSPFNFNWNNITTTYFHGFCKDILNEYGEKWPNSSTDEEKFFREEVPNVVSMIVKNNDYKKYDAILIDEGQDFNIEWYKMLCQFLTDRDEIVIVCDKKQNIYGVDTEWLDKRRSGVEKFGDWIELKKIVRLPERVAKISIDFGEKFNLNQDLKIDKIEKSDLFNKLEDHVIWWNVEEENWLSKVEEAYETIINKATHKHPSDIVILLPDKFFGDQCIKHFESKKKVLVNHVFEDINEKKYHKHKKAFWMGDSRIKMSTIHSFKGWELSNVIVVIPKKTPGFEQLYHSVIYTAITRARENLIIINMNNLYWNFGENYPSVWK